MSSSSNNESMSEMEVFMEHNKLGTAGFLLMFTFVIGALASVYGAMDHMIRLTITISISMIILISYLGLFSFKTVAKITILGLAINVLILVTGLMTKDFYETTRVEKAAATGTVEALEQK
ncbi:MAG: hypothetical protein HRT72_07230 [Flavobacteriales bacterium]|nr:hypothetical protein [Flavobacteriales bacterium]